MKVRTFVFLMTASLVFLAFSLGCENTLIGEMRSNKPPEVWLSSGPVEGDTTGYQVHFYWGGWDPDGEIRAFEFVVVPGRPIGFDPADTTGLDKWHLTMAHDSVIRVSATDTFYKDKRYSSYTRYEQTHTFFLRAIDLLGKRSSPVYRSFTAWTLAPYVDINVPPKPHTSSQPLSWIITFGWRGYDPIDSPENSQDPDSVRFFVTRINNPQGQYDPLFDIVADLNKNPWRYDTLWGPWVWYRAPEDSGKKTVIGDDEVLEKNKLHAFVVQAKDEAGAVTAIFERKLNVREFTVSDKATPLLTITETYLGGFRFMGTNFLPVKKDLPPGVTMKFKWYADASAYGGTIACYQYGWDVADVNNPSDWDSECSPFIRGCEQTWYSGVHTLFVRAIDNSGIETLAQIEINIIPFTMDRNLLWVDDYYSENFPQQYYAMPREDEHDNFWLALCSKAEGFDPNRDVFDVYYSNNARPPLMSLIGRYKNIIWTYGASFKTTGLDDIIYFTPESQIGTGGGSSNINYLSIFLAKGGHLLTEGDSEGFAGMAYCLPQQASGIIIQFPFNLRCEITGITTGCSEDTSGVNTLPYRDYCVTVLDKIQATIRDLSALGYPSRRTFNNYAPIYAEKTTDQWHSIVTGFPERLDFWAEVVAPGRAYDAGDMSKGFGKVEFYNPKYWMDYTLANKQACFHPIYVMRLRSTNAPLDRQAVALFVTKYADVVPDTEGGVAAPSFHFGFELWFFNRSQVNTIMEIILRQWQIYAG